MVIAPHPDDESIGAGGHLAEWRDAWVLLVTDGAPRDLKFARRSGFETREEYAAARRAEFEAAMAVAGVPPDRTRSFWIVDQESALSLAGLTRRVAEVFRRVRPEIVLTPAYEGGHPDHDSTAFAVRMSSRLLPAAEAPAIFEYALYNAGGGEYSAGQFLENSSNSVATVELPGHGLTLKQKMYDCYPTQKQILTRFDPRYERFRVAPDYDFTQPPHDGPLYYDRYNWAIDGQKWRTLAGEALEKLRS